jgi:hypothetical protein
VLVAFSCRGRSFCPSCEKKKQLRWAEWLREEVLQPPVAEGSQRKFSMSVSSAWGIGVFM